SPRATGGALTIGTVNSPSGTSDVTYLGSANTTPMRAVFWADNVPDTNPTPLIGDTYISVAGTSNHPFAEGKLNIGLYGRVLRGVGSFARALEAGTRLWADSPNGRAIVADGVIPINFIGQAGAPGTAVARPADGDFYFQDDGVLWLYTTSAGAF